MSKKGAQKESSANKGLIHGKADVLLISMPFSKLNSPSLSLSLLKAFLSQQDIPTKVIYFNLYFAQLIGANPYLQIGNQSIKSRGGWSVCDWIFSSVLFGYTDQEIEAYVKDILLGSSNPHDRFVKPVSTNFMKLVLEARKNVDRFLDECLREVAGCQPRLVGFTSIIQQHVSSLALAQRIKTHLPETFIVFGGPNCEGVMGTETLRRFPYIDAVLVGEGDIVFPQLVQRVIEEKPVSNLQGVYTQSDHSSPGFNSPHAQAPEVDDMDVLPYPDFDDFFEQLEQRSINLPHPPVITIETSRGCWWGQKNHCTFCGFNGSRIRYRSKSGQRAFDELNYLIQKHQVRGVEIVDSIFNKDYFKDFIPKLVSQNLKTEIGAEFVYQVKANLNKAQLMKLVQAGFKSIQPGIESLNSQVLRLMRKGVSGIQNIQLLKWCKELGITPAWNILWGFPGESEKDYEHMAALIPKLFHLQPPVYAGNFFLIRFSPYFEHAEKFGITNIIPASSYSYIYPFSPEAVANLAYYFYFDYRIQQDVEDYTETVLKECNSWQKSQDRYDLFSIDKGHQIHIWDHRPIASNPLTILSGLQRTLYVACDSAQHISRLQKLLQDHTDWKCQEEDIEHLLDPILEQNLMIKEGHRYLSLAVPVGVYSPKKETIELLQEKLLSWEIQKIQEEFMTRIRSKDISSDLKISREEIKNIL
jgi:ribosomal peptide maturation radical SAM protein 1